jgi:polysaccharide deacetylase family sporulation protein PdaB
LPIYSVETDKKVVALTFDCAWGTDYTDELLSVMQSESVKSTFFTVQFWAEKHPDYLKKISDLGHEIGTHSQTHSHMSELSKDKILSEFSSSVTAIESVTGKKVDLFRAPFGDYNNQLIQTATESGLYTIQWDVDSLDWKNISAQSITERVLKGVKNGSIILFHNNGLHTAKALPSIIKALKAQGYQMVTIGELIYRENYSIDTNGRQRLL